MRKGFLMLESCNIQAKLAFPQEMKDNAKTIENIQKWDDLIKRTREELKYKPLDKESAQPHS
jgi:hypothetical protein